MAEYIKKDDALACFHNWIDSDGEINDPQCMPEYRAIEDLPVVTINDSTEENKVTNCNHIADVDKRT